MALRIVEFFGFGPGNKKATQFIEERSCPFIKASCVKPNHGACAVCQTNEDPVICCPNRLYGDDYVFLKDVAAEAFGGSPTIINIDEFKLKRASGNLLVNQVVVFGHRWGRELPLPTPPGEKKVANKKFYVDWILAQVDDQGTLQEMTAVEVQTVDTTGSYVEQSNNFFAGGSYVDKQDRCPGYSSAGLNWENVNKRILPQLIYKGHVLRREKLCSKGLYFVCPDQVLERVKARLGGQLHEYPPGPGNITFRSYRLSDDLNAKGERKIEFSGQFTTTVDQVALAFTSPQNLPEMGVYQRAIEKNLR